MEWTVHLARKLAFADINIQAGFAGESVLVHLESGAPSRIGCAVLAAPWSVPHEDGSVSAMSSVLSAADSVSAALCSVGRTALPPPEPGGGLHGQLLHGRRFARTAPDAGGCNGASWRHRGHGTGRGTCRVMRRCLKNKRCRSVAVPHRY